MKKKVVITGVGPLTPIGIGKDAYFSALLEGRSGLTKIDTFDVSEYASQIAGLIREFDPLEYMNVKTAKRLDRFSQFAIVAAKIAVEDSGLEIGEHNTDEVGVLVGSGIGGLMTLEKQHKRLLENGPSRVSPFTVPMMLSNMAAGNVSISLKAKGYSNCSVTACSSATHSIGEAYEVIKRGQAKVMIAGGSEAAVVPLALAGFSAMKALSTNNAHPKEASRPFDAQRDGFVMGEGAGIVVLEDYEHAKQRGAHIYAEVAGYGATSDAYHMTAPDPSAYAPAKAIEQAINEETIDIKDVNYINAHGTSTKYNDEIETKAIKKVFKKHAYDLAVSSTKSMTGHLLGAAGGIEAIACVMAIEKGILPPTINYKNADPACDLDYIPNKARNCDINVALSNSLGFGGHNAVLAFRKHCL